MRKKMYWGIGTLIILLGVTAVLLLWDKDTESEVIYKTDVEPARKTETPIAEKPTAREGFEMVQHGDHLHEVPIDAPDTGQDQPHEPNETKQSSIPALPNISSLSKLADDIDPDDIPGFSITGTGGEVYNFDRPLTPEEREMYYKLKADISYWNSTPAGIKMSAIILVRRQKVEEGALHPFFDDWGKGILTDEELDQRLDEFFERTR